MLILLCKETNQFKTTWEKDTDRKSQQRNNEMAQFLKIKEM